MDERRCHDQDVKNLMRVELEGVKEMYMYQYHSLSNKGEKKSCVLYSELYFKMSVSCE